MIINLDEKYVNFLFWPTCQYFLHTFFFFSIKILFFVNIKNSF